MPASAHPEDRFPPAGTEDLNAATNRSSAGGIGGASNGGRVLEETELDSALQLLVERAQYITGATGTALALPQGEEMVCRASAGSSAPAVGARLQVRSGLTGESIARRQLLRCDNAETDPRVNLEACREMGIASIVVLPLLRRNGEVRGLFELFSDHPYAFEERDLIALERMAELTLTALDLAERRQNSAPAPSPKREAGKPAERLSEGLPELLSERLSEVSTAGSAPQTAAIPLSVPPNVPPSIALKPEFAEASVVPVDPSVISSPLVPSLVTTPASEPEAAPAPVPAAMLRVQKCASCGFPVSEGRTLCLDCEKKDSEKRSFEKKQREQEQVQIEQQQGDAQESDGREREEDASPDSAAASAAPAQEEFVPAFLANALPVKESWLANHVNVLAIVVLILGILVAVVVFR
jgi:putative methionine-R-sulfoxide reductase with GAF domain